MTKETAIQILTNLKEQVEKDNFIFNMWEMTCCNNIEKIFVLTHKKKVEQIKSLEPQCYVAPSFGGIPTFEDRQTRSQEIEQDEKRTKEAIKYLLSGYIQEIEDFGLENNNAIKNFWQTNKTDWQFWAVVVTFLTVLSGIGSGLYYLGEKNGATKYEKSKYDLETKADTLIKKNNMLILENKQLKSSFDSLKRLNIDKK